MHTGRVLMGYAHMGWVGVGGGHMGWGGCGGVQTALRRAHGARASARRLNALKVAGRGGFLADDDDDYEDDEDEDEDASMSRDSDDGHEGGQPEEGPPPGSEPLLVQPSAGLGEGGDTGGKEGVAEDVDVHMVASMAHKLGKVRRVGGCSCGRAGGRGGGGLRVPV